MTHVDIQEWIRSQNVRDEMIWKGPFGTQCAFLRDRLASLIVSGLHYTEVEKIAKVISTHTSKSIVLPVVEYSREDLGLKIVVRENFHNWKLSVESERPILADFGGLFHTTPPVEPDYTGDPLHEVYFEGFPKDRIHPYYTQGDRRCWSAEIWGGDEVLWTAVFLVMRSIGGIPVSVWGRRKKEAAVG